MQNRKDKYNGCGTHKRAILHMIGQSVDVFKTEPKTSDIASWMNVSKTTARKHLKKMLDNEELIMSEFLWRKNAKVHTWRLQPDVMIDYRKGRFIRDYHMYAQRVLKVILT